MTKVLIADPNKASLVMSSEVFKDKIPGAVILVAATGKECIEILSHTTPDMCVVDFDLPDTDGVTLITAMRKRYSGPILLTAFPGPIVNEAVNSDLFAFNDAGGWIPKPVKFDALSAKIDRFVVEKHRLGRRFDMELDTLVVGKGAGRGKRAPKAKGKVVNLSMGGVCISLNQPMKMKGGQELMVTLSLPTAGAAPKERATTPTTIAPKKKPSKTPGTGVRRQKTTETKIKATVAWVDRNTQTAGFQFARLTDVQKKGLEELLRSSYGTPA
jgi:CheY-like chemotaxis protein